MKIQIIQLDQNDDYISVRDKMSWIQTGRILLLWPEDCRALERQLELSLVQRYASKIGAHLALVTQNSNVRRIARKLNIPVFDTPDIAQEQGWSSVKELNHFLPTTKDRPNLDSLYRQHSRVQLGSQSPTAKRLFPFGISMLALLALVFFILPSAKIIVSPAIEKQFITLNITSDPSLADINLDTNRLPTYSLDVIVEGSATKTTTGFVDIPDKAASGYLRFTNSSAHNVIIPVGTIVSTKGSDPVRFAVTMEADQRIAAGDSIFLEATAIKPGITGNLPTDSLVMIEDPIGLELNVTNPYRTNGGINSSVPSPTEEDFQHLQQELQGKLAQASLSVLQAGITDQDFLITPSLQTSEVLSETYSPALGNPGSTLDLSMRVRYQVQVISAPVINKLVTLVLDANLRESYSAMEGTLKYHQMTTPRMDIGGRARMTIYAERIIQARINERNIIASVKGSSISNAINKLSDSLSLAKPAEIILSPHWWPRLPMIPLRIQIVKSAG